MINNGDKKLPLDRYPYMENELKKLSSIEDLQEQINDLKNICTELSGSIENINNDITDINTKITDLTDVTIITHPILLRDDISYNVHTNRAVKCGNVVQVLFDFTLTGDVTTPTKIIGLLDYTKIPQPAMMFTMTSQRANAKVSKNNGQIQMVFINDSYMTSGTNFSFYGIYIIEEE